MTVKKSGGVRKRALARKAPVHRVQKKPRKVVAPKPVMKNFEFLSGDLDWKDYGGKWYRHIGDDAYYLIEFINWPDATGELYHGHKYVVIGKVIDLKPGSPWHREIPGALRCCGLTRKQATDEMILDAVDCSMGGDDIFLLHGNNANQLLADAKRRL